RSFVRSPALRRRRKGACVRRGRETGKRFAFRSKGTPQGLYRRRAHVPGSQGEKDPDRGADSAFGANDHVERFVPLPLGEPRRQVLPYLPYRVPGEGRGGASRA